MKYTINLLEFESSMIAKHSPAISTISFFNGNLIDTSTYIKERFLEILKANPWLNGELKKGEKKGINLVYDDNIEIDKLLFMPKDFKIASDFTYSNIILSVNDYVVKTPKDLLNTQSKVCSLVLTKTSENEFAMLFSLSHSVADGHTYYQLLNMLSQDSKVYALSVKRKHELIPRIKESVGYDSYNYFTGLSHSLNALFGILKAKRANVFSYYIDEEKIQTIKNSNKKTTTCPYLSTNDILTSSYGNFIKARLLMIAVNFRGKVKGLSENDAGNYQSYVLYDKKVYKKPCGIRKSISFFIPFQCLVDKLPSFLKGLTCKMGLITNWSSFSKELHLQKATEKLHLPLIQSNGKVSYDMAIIFRAKQNKKAVIYYSNRFNRDDFTNADLLLKSSVSQDIF